MSVGKNDEVQLFYYFFESESESERDPQNDPLVLSLTGGPGCSSLYAIAFEFGPINFDFSTYGSSLPSLVLNSYSWTKMANMIFVDWPVGAGFSYTTNPESYYTSDSKSPKDVYKFLQKWFLMHPMFLKNPLYIQGESYAGKIAPMIAWEISKANEAGLLPQMYLQGYFVGNPITDVYLVKNEKVPYAHNMGLISDEYFKLAECSCNGEYVIPDLNNVQCHYALQLINECLEDLNTYFILDSTCPNSNIAKRDQTFTEVDSVTIALPSSRPKPACREQYYTISETWANNPYVREALHIREGTKGEWVRYNKSVAYAVDVASSAEYHLLLSKKGYRGLVYSGDHDMEAPYSSTLKWIRSLNLTLDDDWRQWKVDKQIAGFTQRYGENGSSFLTFATIKGSGHTAPEFAPKACFAMISRWLSYNPL
ncbi:hypothetical protein ACJIZ3_022938 [Penstemon smallii]|uniref:Carboxypeptidase n=1 Tax=Penstemon smallii TaxID=265156 RepID=A0ABD3TNJ7_9LAMI